MRADFYILEDSAATARALTACRLAAKAYAHGHQVYIHCQDQAAAMTLDNLLWTFKEDSFIPHNLADEPIKPSPPVQLGADELPLHHADIIIPTLSHHLYQQALLLSTRLLLDLQSSLLFPLLGVRFL